MVPQMYTFSWDKKDSSEFTKKRRAGRAQALERLELKANVPICERSTLMQITPRDEEWKGVGANTSAERKKELHGGSYRFYSSGMKTLSCQ